MGRQTRFYMMDERNVQLLTETFIQNGFELIQSKCIQYEDGTVSTIFEPIKIDANVLVQTQYLLDPNRFRKPEYGEFNCFYYSNGKSEVNLLDLSDGLFGEMFGDDG